MAAALTCPLHGEALVAGAAAGSVFSLFSHGRPSASRARAACHSWRLPTALGLFSAELLAISQMGLRGVGSRLWGGPLCPRCCCAAHRRGCSEAALAASYCRSFHFLGCWGSPSGSRTPGKRPARGRDSCKSELCSILTLDLSVPFFRGKGQEDQEEDEAAPSQGGRKEAVGGRVLPLR